MFQTTNQIRIYVSNGLQSTKWPGIRPTSVESAAISCWSHRGKDILPQIFIAKEDCEVLHMFMWLNLTIYWC